MIRLPFLCSFLFCLNTSIYGETIPTNAHFVWLGSAIPTKYQKNIRDFLRWNQKTKFATYLWFDPALIDEKCQTEVTTFCKKNLIHCKKVDEQLLKKGGKIYRQFVQKNELRPAPNYAVASDIVRLNALNLWGGLYFDTDTLFNAPIDFFNAVQKKSPFLAYSYKFLTLDSEKIIINNNILGFPAHHPFLTHFLDEIEHQYQKLFTRSMHQLWFHRLWGEPFFATLQITGPLILTSSFHHFYPTLELTQHIPFLFKTPEIQVIYPESDKTWMIPAETDDDALREKAKVLLYQTALELHLNPPPLETSDYFVYFRLLLDFESKNLESSSFLLEKMIEELKKYTSRD